MAVTLRTILQSAKSRGSFVGVSLNATSKLPAEDGVVKVASVANDYVTFRESRLGIPFKVHKSTIKQVRVNGMAVNKRPVSKGRVFDNFGDVY
jgi:hypothetical protein